VAALSKDLVERGLSAVDWIKAAAKAVGGGGGGRPDLAQAGGKFPDKLQQALADGKQHMARNVFHRQAARAFGDFVSGLQGDLKAVHTSQYGPDPSELNATYVPSREIVERFLKKYPEFADFREEFLAKHDEQIKLDATRWRSA
jgi:hypothetical protein